MASLLWFQGGACSGNTMSFLNAESPSVCDLVTDFGIELLWHPSLGLELGDQAKALFRSLASGERPVAQLSAQELIEAVRHFPGPVIGAVNGPDNGPASAPMVAVGRLRFASAVTVLDAVLTLPAGSVNVSAAMDSDTGPSAMGVSSTLQSVPDPLSTGVAFVTVRSPTTKSVEGSLRVMATV